MSRILAAILLSVSPVTAEPTTPDAIATEWQAAFEKRQAGE